MANTARSQTTETGETGDTSCPAGSGAHAHRREEGQAAVLVVIVAAVLLIVLLVALGAMGRTALDRTRAQTAADAAALASVGGGREAAGELARRHGATVVAWVAGPGPFEVTVTVRLGDTTATARASEAP